MALWITLAVVAALAGARLRLGYPGPRESFRQLSPREVAFVSAAADATFPAGGAIQLSGCEAGIPRYVDRYVDGQSQRTRVLIHLLFLLMEQATLLFPGPGWTGWRRFSTLRRDQQVAVLEGWRRSRFYSRRVAFTSLRAILTMAYLASPAVLRRLELAPLAIATPVQEADLLYPPIGKPRSAIRYTQADRTPPSDGTPLRPDGPLHPAYAEDPP